MDWSSGPGWFVIDLQEDDEHQGLEGCSKQEEVRETAIGNIKKLG